MVWIINEDRIPPTCRDFDAAAEEEGVSWPDLPVPALVRAAIANGLILKEIDLPKSKLTPLYIGPGEGMERDKSLGQILSLISWKQRIEIIFCTFYLIPSN